MENFPVVSMLRFRSAKRNLLGSRFLGSIGNSHSLGGFNKWVLENDCFKEKFTLAVTFIQSRVPPCSCRAGGFGCTTNRSFSSVDNDVGADEDEVGMEGGPRIDSNLDIFWEERHEGKVGMSKNGARVAVANRDLVELYKELCDAETYDNLEHSIWTMLQEVFSYFSKSGWAANQALDVYIGMSYFPTAVRRFCDFFCDRFSPEFVGYVVSLGLSDDAVRFLFPIFVEYCIEHFPDEIKRFKSMIVSADLTKLHMWFPFARAMKCKIVYCIKLYHNKGCVGLSNDKKIKVAWDEVSLEMFTAFWMVLLFLRGNSDIVFKILTG